MLSAYTDERLGQGLGDSNGLSWSCNAARVIGELDAQLQEGDPQVLRQLARTVADFAAKPEMEEKRKLWLDHNSLRATRPLVFCDPENAWYELIPAKQLRCRSPLGRVWEFLLRKEIFWANQIRDDRVTEAVFPVHYVFTKTDIGLPIRMIGGRHGGAYRYDPPLTEYGRMSELKPRQIVVDHQKTRALWSLASEVFDGILTVELRGVWWWSFGLTGDAIALRGMEPFLYDMVDNPDELHRLMAFLRDEALATLDFLEKESLLTLNNIGDFIGTGGYGFCRDLPAQPFHTDHVMPKDMWGFAESQETVGVSPEMFEAFVFAYQAPILERFGLGIYGCCEPLETRMEIIKRIPRLRKVTVSPWSNTRTMAEHIGKDYIYCWKMNPSCIAVEHPGWDAVRAEIAKTLKDAKMHDCRVQMLMRDVLTLSSKAENAIQWTRIAMEEAQKA